MPGGSALNTAVHLASLVGPGRVSFYVPGQPGWRTLVLFWTIQKSPQKCPTKRRFETSRRLWAVMPWLTRYVSDWKLMELKLGMKVTSLTDLVGQWRYCLWIPGWWGAVQNMFFSHAPRLKKGGCNRWSVGFADCLPCLCCKVRWIFEYLIPGKVHVEQRWLVQNRLDLRVCKELKELFSIFFYDFFMFLLWFFMILFMFFFGLFFLMFFSLKFMNKFMNKFMTLGDPKIIKKS